MPSAPNIGFMSPTAMSDSAIAEREDTERLFSWANFPDLPTAGPTPWHQRTSVVLAAGFLGLVGLVVLVIAVVTVSNDSTHPATTRASVTSSASVLPTQTTAPSTEATAPPANTTEVPPTVPETAATENSTPPPAASEPPASPPNPGGAHNYWRWWRPLFPHWYPGGQ